MFQENMSVSIVLLCKARHLSYEAAAEQCDLSTRYFSDIARGKVSFSVTILEKVCNGFRVTPNDLLLPGTLTSNSFQLPMRVTHFRQRYDSGKTTSYPVCPRCGKVIDREYQCFCVCCGQALDWSALKHAKVLI